MPAQETAAKGMSANLAANTSQKTRKRRLTASGMGNPSEMTSQMGCLAGLTCPAHAHSNMAATTTTLTNAINQRVIFLKVPNYEL